MLNGPFYREGQGSLGQMADDYFQCANVYLDFMFGIKCMEVRGRMLPPKHLDDDTEELTDGWHGEPRRRGGLKNSGFLRVDRNI